MDRALWITWYDLPSDGREAYLTWAHETYIPALLERRDYDAYGPKRMFWGTDLARLPCTYKEAVTMFIEEIPWLTTEDKAWIMGRGLCEWLGWKMPAHA